MKTATNRAVLLLAVASLVAPLTPIAERHARAEAVDERGLVALDQSLRDMANPFTVMCVAAAAEQVDYGTLAYYRKSMGARAVMVIAMRGSEQAVGARTRETLGAARITGADLYYLNLRDSGPTKSAEEVTSIWGYETALERLVRAIRSLRPDVIVTGHDEKSGDGYDQVMARLIADSFSASADAERFPDMQLKAWQVRRIFRKVDDKGADVTINLNEQDIIRGRTYARMAADARSRLAPRPAAPAQIETGPVHYRLIKSAKDEEMKPGSSLLAGLSIPENLSMSIKPPRVGDLSALEAMHMRERLVGALAQKLAEKRAEGSSEELYARYGGEFSRVIRFTEAIERALALALGLSFEVSLADQALVPEQRLAGRMTLRNGGDQALPVVFHTPDSLPLGGKKPAYKESEITEIAPKGVITREFVYEVPKDAAMTIPHSAHLFGENYFPMGSSLPGAQPDNGFGVRLVMVAEIGVTHATFAMPVVARFDVVPQVEMIVDPPFAHVRDWSETREMEFLVRVRNRTPGALAGALWVVPLALVEESYEPAHLRFSREDEEQPLKLKLKLPVLKPPLAPDLLLEFRREKPAPPDALGSINISVSLVDYLVAEGIRVGYVGGGDGWLENLLGGFGINKTELSTDDLIRTEHGNAAQVEKPTASGCADLSRFDTILLDYGAYAGAPDLASSNRCLLDYVRRGGNLVVFQQPTREDFASLAPFEIKLSAERITNEKSPVKLLDPDHPLMARPNRITEKDFEGWSQERAAYLPSLWAGQYTPLLESADPGQEPQKGGLLVARLDGGTYVYTSFDWRRQAARANPGALRMLANLISLPRTIKDEANKQ